VAYVFIV